MLLIEFFLLWRTFIKKRPPQKYTFIVYIFQRDLWINEIPQYCTNVKCIDSLDDVGWFDLIFRKAHFFGVPRQSGKSRKIKRLIIKLLHLEVRKELACLNILSFLFDRDERKSIFVPSMHVVDTFKFLFPSYKINHEWGEIPKSVYYLLTILIHLNFNQVVNYSTQTTIFINDQYLSFIKYYRYVNPNKKIILRFHDKIDSNKIKLLLTVVRHFLDEGIINQAESYCRTDAKQLGITYRGNGINADMIKKYKNIAKQFLCIFIGNGDNHRMVGFSPVMNQLQKIGYDTQKVIKFMTLKLPEERISYNQYLSIIATSEVLVDMLHYDQDEGYSLRIPEALFLNRKVITDRVNIVQEPFYDSSRFFIIGKDSLDRLKSFLEEPIESIPQAILQQYDVNNWWQDV